MSTQSQRADAFRALHEGDPFVIPNPWDAGSARVLAALGFPALATTSSGLAMSLGRRDGEVSLDEVVRHVGALSDATDLPVAVDLERGHGDNPADAARAITAVAAAGAVGASIEDWSAAAGIDPVGAAAERIAAAVAAARSLPHDFVLTARAENHIRGNPDLGDTIARLQAYERAGADVLYAPGLRSVAEVRQVCAAVSRPVNVLALPGLDVPGIFAARRTARQRRRWPRPGCHARPCRRRDRAARPRRRGGVRRRAAARRVVRLTGRTACATAVAAGEEWRPLWRPLSAD